MINTQKNNISVDGFQDTHSVEAPQQQEEQKNEFLDDTFQYETCPFCSRNFFLGKLKYHLKLCKPNQPMTKSPLRKTKRQFLQQQQKKEVHQQESQQSKQSPFYHQQQKKAHNKESHGYEKCHICKSNIPSYLKASHVERCNQRLKYESNYNPQGAEQQIRSKTKMEFNKIQKHTPTVLPRIQNSAKERKFSEKRKNMTDLRELGEYTVKVREDLSCFKKALQVQQIQCKFCGRKFSKEASLRHIPICEKLKQQQKHSLALNKHCKSELYKSTTPIKKNTLFRKKLIENNSENIDNEMKNSSLKTARMFKSTNSKLAVRAEEKQEGRISKISMNNRSKNNESETLCKKPSTTTARPLVKAKLNFHSKPSKELLKEKVQKESSGLIILEKSPQNKSEAKIQNKSHQQIKVESEFHQKPSELEPQTIEKVRISAENHSQQMKVNPENSAQQQQKDCLRQSVHSKADYEQDFE